ncbi:MAG: sulfite exporter TauE/SafE family protein [Verrucomicrobia bacterium]|nr:sulfite exporter TauE/SafE family protein [Verrucomicrobiota bacterium]
MSWIEIVSLLTAACAAGAVNAVAGGGTLITFPTLILFGVPPMIANATSTLALVVGMGGSLYGYRNHIADVKPWFTTFIPVSIAGGWIGSLLLTRSSEQVFTELVPYLVLFATVLFMLQGVVSGRLGRQLHASDSPTSRRPHLFVALFFQFLVSIYGGYFGAGIGILMLATLGFMGFKNIHQMNTLKSVLGSLINLVAAAWFTASGLIDWPRMGLMTVGAFAGYYIASTYSQRLPQKAVRRLIAIIGLIITAVMFWKL